MSGTTGWWTAILLAAFGVRRSAFGVRRSAFGVGLVGSALFPPDPVAGFPPGAEAGEATASDAHRRLSQGRA